MKDFKDKVAVITGAGRGIGRGIALRCAQEGMNIVLAGIRTEPLEKTAAELNALGADTLICQTDVSVLADVENLAEKSYETFGAVHLLVNNAGVGAPGTVWESSMDDWNWVMGVNFYGVLHGVRTFIPRMIAQQPAAHIVNVSSLAGVVRAGGSYGVSKHAVVALSEALYEDLAENAPQITISVYCPGYVDTDLDQIDTDERPRPQQFSENSTNGWTDERRADLRDSFDKGFSIEESAGFLFDGIQNDQLYIGPKAFNSQEIIHSHIGDLHDIILNRAENIINERNPALSV